MMTETMTVELADELTEIGADFLDTKRPGWAAQVDEQTLATHSITHCVLAQSGDYYEGITAWQTEHPGNHRNGFCNPFPQWWEDDHQGWRTLDAAWKRRIAERKA
jgi:hypothetical protein